MNPVVFASTGEFSENSYLIRYKNDAVVIDPGFNGEAIVNYLEEKGYLLKMVLLTHGHYDHMRDLRILQKTLVFPIYIHETDALLLRDDVRNGSKYFRSSFRLREGQEIRMVRDGDEIPFGNAPIRVIHTPGHTAGSVCYEIQDILFSGDTLFHGDLGRTDLDTGSSKQMAATVRKLFAMLSDRVVVYPGHEEATDIGTERRNNHDVVAYLKSRG
ncbi:MAG: MBL fold metallo-hydrolase [bacterium]